MNHQELLKIARNFAIEQHGTQTYGEHDYVYHLDQVYNVAVLLNLGPEYEIAAYLHDLIEDTSITKEIIAEKFGLNIANLVFAVSGFGVNRAERTEDIKSKLILFPKAINLKMMDRYANLCSSKVNKPSLFKTYKKEHEVFRSLFEQGDFRLFSLIEDVLEIPKLKTSFHMK